MGLMEVQRLHEGVFSRKNFEISTLEPRLIILRNRHPELSFWIYKEKKKNCKLNLAKNFNVMGAVAFYH